MDAADPSSLAAPLTGLLDHVSGMRLTMTGLGFFLTDRAPAYLVVSPTTDLLTLHARVHHAIEKGSGRSRSWPYYRPGSWIPHCTLAMDVACQSTVAEALSGTPLPLVGTVASAELLPLPASVGPG